MEIKERKTPIKISESTWLGLNKLKVQSGDSFDKVIARLLEKNGGKQEDITYE